MRSLYDLGARRAPAEVSRYRDCPSPVTSSQIRLGISFFVNRYKNRKARKWK